MFKVVAVVVVGLAAAALVMLALQGLIFLADTGTSLDLEADDRGGQPLAASFGTSEDWSSADLQAIRDRATEYGVHALICLHRGRVVAEWGATDRVSGLHGAGASVVSLLFGIAADRGLMDLDLAMAELGGDDRDVDALGAVFTRRTGLPLGRAIDQWLAEPLGLVDYDTTAVSFEPAADSDYPRCKISMSARDMARLGQMVLDRGRGHGVQVVPATWIDESTRPRSKAGRGLAGGYFGYGWWIPVSGEVEARGHGGERIWIDRQHDLVCVARVFSGTNPSERATWTVLGGRFSDGEFRRLVTELESAGGLGILDPRFAELVDDGDIVAAVAHVHEQRTVDPHIFLFTEAQLNDLGYRLLGDDRVDDAIAVFRLNVETYPEFANTHDSLGEALLEKGELTESAACYRRALELDPESRSARRQLRRIEDRDQRAPE